MVQARWTGEGLLGLLGHSLKQIEKAELTPGCVLVYSLTIRSIQPPMKMI